MSKKMAILYLSTVFAALYCTAQSATARVLQGSPAILQESPQQVTNPVAKPMREPIRTGGNVQESKLIARVEPVYPESAKSARISGVVILQAIINEAGEVYEIKVLRGHPLLSDAALDAVRQWRYSPTMLNGLPVPVIATVTVVFNLSSNELSVKLDEFGSLSSPDLPADAAVLLQKMKESRDGIQIQPGPTVPTRVIEQTIASLQKGGIDKIRVSGFELREERLFAVASPANLSGIGGIGAGPGGPANVPVAPLVVLNNELLSGIAKSSGMTDNLPPQQRPLLYKMYVNEVGEIVGIQQLRGPKIPALESELLRTRVLSPGRRGADPAAVVFYLEVAVP